jgi:DNA helicase-2/ATP-dependent DNA helicase PcrA
VDFDDLIMKTVQLARSSMKRCRSYQERFQYVLVDEYQDINHAQFRLVELHRAGAPEYLRRRR